MISRSRSWLRMAAMTVAAAIAAFLAITQPTADTLRGWAMGVQTDRHQRVRTADGQQLATTVMRPLWHRGPLPTVLIRTPYGRASQGRGWARQGFAVVVQDMRGRGESTGRFEPYTHEASDYRDAIDWIVAQPWSNGRVGTLGCSASGESQLIAAAHPHPAHRALIAEGAGGAVGSAGSRHAYFAVYENGVFQLASALGWFARHGDRGSADAPTHVTSDTLARTLPTLPVAGMAQRAGATDNDFDLFRQLPPGADRWQALGYLHEASRPALPTLHVNGWYDQGVSETLFTAQWMQSANPPVPQWVVIGPGRHCEDPGPAKRTVGDLEVTDADAAFRSPASDAEALYARWLRTWLTHDESAAAQRMAGEPTFRFFMLRENSWLNAQQWPPEQAAAQRWQLHSDGHANGAAGGGKLIDVAVNASPRGRALAHVAEPSVTDRFIADPNQPVPTRGGAFCCTGDALAREGPVDQSEVQNRPDVLVYTSEPLAAPLRIAGPLSLALTVSTSAQDADFVAKLVDVSPDGRSLLIQSGVLRLSWRHLMDEPGGTVVSPKPVAPNERLEIRIPMRDIAWRVESGHRLRLLIAGSDFPRLERNLHTGNDNSTQTLSIVAEHRVHHGPMSLSQLELYALPNLPRP